MCIRDRYNVVGGIVTMFSFLNGTMAASTPVSYTHLDVYKRQVAVRLTMLGCAFVDIPVGCVEPLEK